MKKTYKIEVDCANCANLMEDAAKKDRRSRRCGGEFHDTENDCTVRGWARDEVGYEDVLKACKKIEAGL